MPTRVSILMPFFNAERFLGEAIESVIAQTYPHWELLLVDDGATDGSTEIAQRYCAADPDRIRYLAHEGRANRGASAARNLGLQYATGEYIALLDADDVWLPEKLEQQVGLLGSMPHVDAVYGKTVLWYSWTGRPEDRKRDRVQDLGVPVNQRLEPPALLARTIRQKAPVPCTCSILMRRDAVEAVGGFEDAFRYIYTDQVFYAKLLLDAPVYVADEVWDRYRQHPDSSCHRAWAAGEWHPELPHPIRLTFLEWYEGYLGARGHQRTALWRALQKELWLHRHPALHHLLVRLRLLPDLLKRYGWERGVPLLFRAGRLLLPAPLRERLWTRWLRQHF